MAAPHAVAQERDAPVSASGRCGRRGEGGEGVSEAVDFRSASTVLVKHFDRSCGTGEEMLKETVLATFSQHHPAPVPG